MKLVVGLGNPGRRYEGTRHNVGYSVVARVAERSGVGAWRSRFHSECADTEIEGQRVLLLRPTTYMNLSGRAVGEAKAFFKLENSDILVICDDMSLPLGKLRFRARGSSGGQKGLEDIIHRLGADDFHRLRLGIGAAPAGWDWANYVLGRFSEDERAEIESSIERAAEAVADWVNQGIEYCMNHYN